MLLTRIVKMFFNTKHFPSLPFCGTHTKPHGVRGSSKHYHMLFDPKLGHETSEIRIIPCACVECMSVLVKPWVCDLTPQKTTLPPTCNRVHILASDRLI